MGETIHMSEKELDRIRVLTELQAKKLTQAQAASILGLTDRQVRRLLVKLQQIRRIAIL